MSKSSKSQFYTLLGWIVFSLAKRQAKKRLHVGGSGSKGKKLLLAGAGVAAVGGAAYVASNSSNQTPS